MRLVAGRSFSSRFLRTIALNLTIDTFAWVEILRGTPLGRRAQGFMNEAEDCFTPSVALAEVASVAVRSGLSDAQIRDELRFVAEGSRIVPIDGRLAVVAARALPELRESARARGLRTPGLSDALVLATARVLGAKLLTGDRHFHSCSETVWLESPGGARG